MWFKQKYLFKCEKCNLILEVELEEKELEKINEGEYYVDCECGTQCIFLRD